MKNKIITGVLTLALVTGGGASIHHHIKAENKMEDAHKTISTLDNNIKTKSTEIANLENAIVEKDKKLQADKLVIEKQKLQLKQMDSRLTKVKDENKDIKSDIRRLNAQKNQQRQVMPSRGSVSQHRTINVLATSYVALCSTGCIGITKTGIDVRNYPSKKIIAVDPSIIPLHSKVKITLPDGETFFSVAEDTGGDIKGHRIDILMATEQEAINFGKQNVSVTILE